MGPHHTETEFEFHSKSDEKPLRFEPKDWGTRASSGCRRVAVGAAEKEGGEEAGARSPWVRSSQ